jgi:hypothetical protein
MAVVAAPSVGARPAAQPTLTVSAKVLGFGDNIVVRGKADAPAGTTVELWSHACGFTEAVPVAMGKTLTGGAYAFNIEPMLNSVYSVKVGDATSATATVKVRPLVQLRRLKAAVFGIDVSVGNGQWFTTKVSLQTLDKRTRRWTTVGSASLKPNSDVAAVIAVSSTTIRKHVPRGTTVRAVMSRNSVGACYLPATSSSIGA